MSTKAATVTYDVVINQSVKALALTTHQGAVSAVVANVSCILVLRTGVARPGITALSWAWFDAPDPVDFIAPTDTGEVEVTDGTGLIEVEIPGPTLGTGETGSLVVRADDGSAYGVYNLEVA